MNPSIIRFKGYSWEHNPETLKITKSHRYSESDVAGGSTVLSGFGTRRRTVSGTGQLKGEDCIYQYTRLLKLQAGLDSGVLCLPDMKPFYAFFKSLELTCEPTPELITYSFEFVEDCSKNNSEKEKYYHMVVGSETLWDISFMYSVGIDELVALNPEIKRVDELAQGSKVRLC